MPCKNSNCPRNHVSEDELIRLTAKQLRNTETPIEITSQLGAASSCAKCANEMIAQWLDELRFLKKLRSKHHISRLTRGAND